MKALKIIASPVILTAGVALGLWWAMQRIRLRNRVRRKIASVAT